MTAAPHVLGLVVEGPSDARTIPGLVARILSTACPDVTVDLRGLDARRTFLAWANVEHEARQRRVPRRHGHFGGEPAVEDARAAWYALQMFVGEQPRPAAVILVRDSDGKRKEREKGLEQARGDRTWPFEVVIGVAHPMRECWVLAGFIPQTKEEKGTLSKLRRELGFDPTERSEDLRASKMTDPKSPKRMLATLTGGDEEREAQCWTDTALEHLRQRGAENGLAAFMREAEHKLPPVLAGRASAC